MKAWIVKSIFVVFWLVIYYEILFDESLRLILFEFVVNYSFYAPVTLIFLQIALASFGFPGSPVTLLAGLLWGFELGLLYSIIGSILASLWTFSIGRFLLKKRCQFNYLFEKGQQVFALISRYHWKASFLAHINPVFPGALLGYFFGISEVSLRSFFLGAVLGTFPLQILIVGAGDSSRELMLGNYRALGLAIVASLAFLLLLKTMGRKYFKS